MEDRHLEASLTAESEGRRRARDSTGEGWKASGARWIESEEGWIESGEAWIESGEWWSRARRLGPLPYSALGRRSLAPLSPGAIGALAGWTAQAADRWWADAGRPDPFTLTVVSADDGRVAAGVLAAGPVVAPALRYVVVNPDPSGRAEPPADLVRTLPLEDPAFLYPAAPAGGRVGGSSGGSGGASGAGGGAGGASGSIGAAGGAGGGSSGAAGAVSIDDDDDPFEERPPARGIGPLVTFLNDVPSLGEADGAIVAAGLLSRLEFDLYERRAGKWVELRMAARGDDLVEIAVEAAGLPPVGGRAAPVGGRAASVEGEEPRAGAGEEPGSAAGEEPGAGAARRYRRPTGAAAWLRRVLPSTSSGRLAVLDEWGAALDLDQLRQIREPVYPQPRPLPGTPWSVVEWRLG